MNQQTVDETTNERTEQTKEPPHQWAKQYSATNNENQQPTRKNQ